MFLIDPKSWHFRLYDVYAKQDLWEEEKVNFCKYASWVAWGATVAFIASFIGAIVLLGPLQLFGSILLWLVTDNELMWLLPQAETPSTFLEWAGTIAIVLMIIEALVGIFSICIWITNQIRDRFLFHWDRALTAMYKGSAACAEIATPGFLRHCMHPGRRSIVQL